MRAIVRWTANIAGASLVLMMIVTVMDILLRNTGLAALRGTIEISTMTVVLIGLLALPYSFLPNGHIIVDLATNWLPQRVTDKIDRVCLAISALILTVVAYFMWEASVDVYQRNSLSADLQIPLYLFWIPATVGVSLSVLSCVMAAFSAVDHDLPHIE